MFFNKFSEDDQYIYLQPLDGESAKWKLISQEELDEMVEENRLSDGCKLFKVEKEIKVSFEKITHLD